MQEIDTLTLKFRSSQQPPGEVQEEVVAAYQKELAEPRSAGPTAAALKGGPVIHLVAKPRSVGVSGHCGGGSAGSSLIWQKSVSPRASLEAQNTRMLGIRQLELDFCRRY